MFGTIPEHFSSALFIGAGRDECAMFGLLEPGLVLGLVACLALCCLYACCVCGDQILAKGCRLDLGWIGFSLGLSHFHAWLSLGLVCV